MSIQQRESFYVDFLGFTVDWEHRFEPNTPLYMQVSKGQCVLHLSEHHGDCSPGSAIRIETADIDAFHADLASKDYKYVHNVLNPRSGGGNPRAPREGTSVRSCSLVLR